MQSEQNFDGKAVRMQALYRFFERNTGGFLRRASNIHNTKFSSQWKCGQRIKTSLDAVSILVGEPVPIFCHHSLTNKIIWQSKINSEYFLN